jgi:hypothetical protein
MSERNSGNSGEETRVFRSKPALRKNARSFSGKSPKIRSIVSKVAKIGEPEAPRQW